MRFAWLPFVMMLAFAACGDGPSVYVPSGRYDLAWTDAVQDVASGRDWGRDTGVGAEVVGADGQATDARFDVPETGDALPGDVDGDGGATYDLATDGAEDGLGDPGAADAWADDPGGTDPGPVDPGPVDPGVSDPGPVDPGTSDPGTEPSTLAIRFVAANLTSGSYQSYDPGHGIRLMAGCRADVLLVQEFNYGDNGASDYREMADDICGIECSYSVGYGSIPNGVVSRWPIVASGYWSDPNITNRDLDWVRIDLPGEKDLFAVSVHLHTSPSSDQVGAAQVVAREVAAYRAAHPGCCWYVVGGDFNGPSAVSSSGFGSYDGEAVFSVSGPDPVGEDGLEGTNASREKQYDFVLLDTALRAWQVATVFPANGGSSSRTYPNGLVFDSRNFSQTELDVYFSPARTGDSDASQMQHMAVVKDVVVPR